MRIFKKYAPMQIAKYVSAFFKGEFLIQGLGVFTFDKGRVVSNMTQNEKVKKTTKEINRYIASLRKSSYIKHGYI